MRVLFDTNAYSRLMQGDSYALTVANGAASIILCSVVLGELQFGFKVGARYERNMSDLADFCSDSRVSKFYSSSETVRYYAELMASLRRAGTPIPTNDVWIGAFARELNAQVFSYDGHMGKMVPFGVQKILERVRSSVAKLMSASVAAAPQR